MWRSPKRHNGQSAYALHFCQGLQLWPPLGSFSGPLPHTPLNAPLSLLAMDHLWAKVFKRLLHWPRRKILSRNTHCVYLLFPPYYCIFPTRPVLLTRKDGSLCKICVGCIRRDEHCAWVQTHNEFTSDAVIPFF